MKARGKLCKIDRILRGDIRKKDFLYIKATLENNIEEDLFVNERMQDLRHQLNEVFNEDFKKLFVIVISKDPTYCIQWKHNTMLMLRIKELTLFFYQGKHLDIPKIYKIEELEYGKAKDPSVEARFQSIIVKEERNISESNPDFLANLRRWLALYFDKHAETLKKNTDDFEKNLITSLRMFLLLEAKEGYWNAFYSQKVEAILPPLEPREKFAVLEFNNDDYKHLKNKKKLIIFQKRGARDNFVTSLLSKPKEVVGFLCMFGLFITMIVCRDYKSFDANRPASANNSTEFNDTTGNQSVINGWGDDGSDGAYGEDNLASSAIKLTLKQQFCMEKGNILISLGMIFFGMIGANMIQKAIKKRRAQRTGQAVIEQIKENKTLKNKSLPTQISSFF